MELLTYPGVLRSVTKSTMRVTAAKDAGNAVLGSLAIAQTDRPLPVAVEFPLDVLDQQTEAAPGARVPAGARRQPDHDAIADAASRLTSAKRTVIYCGGGAVSSAAPGATSSSAAPASTA